MKIGDKKDVERYDEGWKVDSSELTWKCPLCGKSETMGDMWEGIDKNDLMYSDAYCDGCEAEFEIEIHGETRWHPVGDFQIKRVK